MNQPNLNWFYFHIVLALIVIVFENTDPLNSFLFVMNWFATQPENAKANARILMTYDILLWFLI